MTLTSLILHVVDLEVDLAHLARVSSISSIFQVHFENIATQSTVRAPFKQLLCINILFQSTTDYYR